METKNLADLYHLDPVPWERALETLENEKIIGNQTAFLATTRPDGRPHLTGVGAIWFDGRVWIVSGPGTRKSQNLAERPDCSVAMSFDGLDLVIEGRAERVTDDATLQRVAEQYAKGGWPA